MCDNLKVKKKDKTRRMECVSHQWAREVVTRGECEFVNRGQIMKGKISFVRCLGFYTEKHQEP